MGMRIGIVTQPLEMNYGGILQNWALQQVLKRMGHEPITIDAYQRYSTLHFTFNWLRVAVKRLLGKKIKYPTRYCGALRNELMGQFIEHRIDKTQVMWDYKRSLVNKYDLDALVVGSDQVWRVAYNGDHIEDMYLQFAQGLPLKRVAYGASFGVDDWDYTESQTATCAALAQQMDAISVRETSGVKLCHDYLGIDAVRVLDPTMLLTADDYNEIINKDWDAREPYLAVYCLDITPAKEAFFNQVAEKHGLNVRYFSAGWKSQLSVEQWLAMIKNATMVVTDSFHGTVFSILFEREFYTLSNPSRGITRMTDFLKSLGLEHRQLSDTAPVEPSEQDIDWQVVQQRVSSDRQVSMAFLTTALGN